MTGMKSVPLFKDGANGNTLGTIKDSVNPMVASALTITKDAMPASSQALTNQNKLSALVGKMIDQWLDILDKYNSKLFSGEASSIKMVDELITDGKVLNYKDLPDTQQLAKTLSKTIFGLLMPAAWKVSAADVRPFIMRPDDDKAGCGGLDPDKYFPKADGSSVFVCYEGHGYWLVNVQGPWQTCSNSKEGPVCDYKKFSKLPGLDTVDGNNWGGVTRSDLVISSVKAFKANGNKNGLKLNLKDPKTVDRLFDEGLRTAGVTSLPICTGKEAWDNWAQAKDTPNFPCN